MKKLKKTVCYILILCALLLCGCSNSAAPGNNPPDMGPAPGGPGMGGAPGMPVQDVEVLPSALDTEDMFTQRDLAGVAAEGAVDIKLTGDGAECASPAVQVDGSVVKITDEGCFVLSGTLEGMVMVDAEKTDKVQLVLDGARISSKSSAAIYVRQAKKVFITLSDGSDNALSNGGGFTPVDSNNIDAAVFSKDDLTLNGSGRISVSSPAGHGIVSKNDLVICGGDWSISADRHGLCGDDSIRVSGGSVNITAGKRGFKAESDEADKGYIYIAGGIVTVTSDKDALSASGEVLIAGGTISLNQCSEGIEAQRIELRGGEVSIHAEDDGINASSDASADCAVLITSGTLTITAGGDGIDSNGALSVCGGDIRIFADNSSGNGALDYISGGAITGGRVIACGGAGLAMNFSESSTQGSILVNVGMQQPSCVSLSNGDGKVALLSCDAPAPYSCVLISCPEIVQGGSYTLTAGGYSEKITMDSLLYGGGMGGFPGGQPEGGFPGGKPPQGKPDGKGAAKNG